ncbi:MAG: glycosyltransferase [Sphingomonadales bacterium]|nr:glycosyltransferase [Sphingomonadales bacterium]
MPRHDRPLVICDLTQSYAPHGGGGVSCYLREKRRHILARTPHTLVQIVPGEVDRVVANDRHVWIEVAAPPVRGSPNYRFILRTGAVREALERYRPDVIESLCPWVLPWTAINYRRANPGTALVAGYHTDFPNAHIHRVGAGLFGDTVANWLRQISINYAEITYREFDRVYALDEATRGALHAYGIGHVDVFDLGVDADLFSPARRDPGYHDRLGLHGDGPRLIYAGRIDNEKRADRLVAMFRHLPPELGARLVMLGDGKLREALVAQTAGMAVRLPGFVQNREELATALASSDIYVSAMADETFGLSVIEAQACGLPVVGVRSGAMPSRVPDGLGLLGPVDDAAAMAANVMRVWQGDGEAMGRAARVHVASRYGWERVFGRLLDDIYVKALDLAAQRRAAAAAPFMLRHGLRAGSRKPRVFAEIE